MDSKYSPKPARHDFNTSSIIYSSPLTTPSKYQQRLQRASTVQHSTYLSPGSTYHSPTTDDGYSNNSANSVIRAFRELQTKQKNMLGGNCFAGLDDAGYLHIFRGQPVGVYHSVWSSSKHDTQGTFGFERYQLQLLRAGELRIHEVRIVDQVCVWSSASASCNAYITSARMAVAKTRIALHKACTFANLLNLPSRIAHSNMVKYMRSGVSAFHQQLRNKVNVMVCYGKYAWGKYIIPRFNGNANGENSENYANGSRSGLEACLSAVHSSHTQSKANGRKRKPKGF